MNRANFIAQMEEMNDFLPSGTNLGLERMDLTTLTIAADSADFTAAEIGPAGEVEIKNSAGNVVYGSGSSVPDAEAGWALRAVFIRTFGSGLGVAGVFVNCGTTTVSNFLPINGLQPPPISIGATPRTVTIAEAGTTFITSIADVVFTLPDVTTAPAGLCYTFLQNSLSSGTGMSLSPAATDKITGLGITPADDKDLINTGATDAVGDFCAVTSDGVDGWYAGPSRGIWARQA